MDKTGDVGIRRNQWQRLFRWQRGQKVTEEGEDGVKDEGKQNASVDSKLKVK